MILEAIYGDFAATQLYFLVVLYVGVIFCLGGGLFSYPSCWLGFCWLRFCIVFG